MERLRFRVAVRGQLVEVDMEPGGTTYRLVEGDGLLISHGGEPLRLRRGADVWRPVIEPAEDGRRPTARRVGLPGPGGRRAQLERPGRCTSALGVRAPSSMPSRPVEIVTPTAVSAAGCTMASAATAAGSTGWPAAIGSATSSVAATAAGPAPGAAASRPTLRDARGEDHGGRGGQSEGEQEAGQRAQPQDARQELERQHLAQPAARPAQDGQATADLVDEAAHARRADGEQSDDRSGHRRGPDQRRRRRVDRPDPHPHRDQRDDHPEDRLERALGGECAGERGPARVAQLALGERDADRIAAARGQDAGQPGAAQVPGHGAPTGDAGPRGAEHAAPGDPARNLRAQTCRGTAATSRPTFARASASTSCSAAEDPTPATYTRSPLRASRLWSAYRPAVSRSAFSTTRATSTRDATPNLWNRLRM